MYHSGTQHGLACYQVVDGEEHPSESCGGAFALGHSESEHRTPPESLSSQPDGARADVVRADSPHAGSACHRHERGNAADPEYDADSSTGSGGHREFGLSAAGLALGLDVGTQRGGA